MSAAPPRIAHIGLGAFHRSHQAWYTDRVNRAADGEPWRIVAFTVRSPRAAEELAARDCRYPLVLLGRDTDTVEWIDAIAEARDGADAARWREAAASVALITVTITEAGYRMSEGDAAATRDALHAGALPATVPGRLVDGLRARRAAGGGPVAIVSCDNLRDNGGVLERAVLGLAREVDTDLATWIAHEASFVSTAVDRITPAPDPAMLPVELRGDPTALVAEDYASWILAGDFPAGRPQWQLAGAEFVDDIVPYELRKLWLLNAGHTLLASLGLLRGHASVAEAMDDPVCRAALDALWADASDVLPFPYDETSRVCTAIAERFENPRIRHELRQIARDSELKLRERVVPVIAERLRRGLAPGDGELTALAAWGAAIRAGVLAGPDLGAPGAGTEAAATTLLQTLAPELAGGPDGAALTASAALLIRTLEGTAS
ncbi:mannitol dehydrogenase family protein [Microbacterium sp. NEAU-LLC]|uniref:Mannitol dehydrogenase family protein n=1 Tax=Microbacterium helvum TaxID=2773713 RepID=A0ABR8NTH0_9MICO|nr:mannitol dehydrogenase family protein [Microbacterium helvum]MBD3943883.1 mannitol dehydrogenase family protein [Microbacterium helvum]